MATEAGQAFLEALRGRRDRKAPAALALAEKAVPMIEAEAREGLRARVVALSERTPGDCLDRTAVLEAVS